MEKDSINELTFQLMNEYYSKIESYCYKDGKPLTKNNKMAGNIFAMIIKKYIESILENHKLKYKVSLNNSYINGCKTEWDLLIVDADDDVNIYNPENVKCIIELKTASHFFSETLNGRKDKERQDFFEYCIKKDFKIIFDNIPNKIRYLYISLFQNPDRGAKYIKEVVKKYNNKDETTFFFIENKNYHEKEIIESVKNKTTEYIEGDFENFIINALKD